MDLNQILPEKQPPHGGLLRLKRRMEASHRRRLTGHRLAWGFAAAAAVVGILLWNVRPQPQPMPFEPADLLALGVQEPENFEPTGAAGEGFLKLKETEEVVYYRLIRPGSGWHENQP